MPRVSVAGNQSVSLVQDLRLMEEFENSHRFCSSWSQNCGLIKLKVRCDEGRDDPSPTLEPSPFVQSIGSTCE